MANLVEQQPSLQRLAARIMVVALAGPACASSSTPTPLSSSAGSAGTSATPSRSGPPATRLVLDDATLHAQGTGSPEPGGLSSRELLRAARRLSAAVAPVMDLGNRIACLLAHRCLTEGLTGIAKRKLGLTSPEYLNARAADGPRSIVPQETGA